VPVSVNRAALGRAHLSVRANPHRGNTKGSCPFVSGSKIGGTVLLAERG